MNRRVILGWSPVCYDKDFFTTPKEFTDTHRLSPCQAGAFTFLARYQFERNPWLLQQSCLLLRLIIDHSKRHLSLFSRIRKLSYRPVYITVRLTDIAIYSMDLNHFCVINGLDSRISAVLKLICEAPTLENLLEAVELIENLDLP